MYYSYVMGIDESILSLESKGFIIDKVGKNYSLFGIVFPLNSSV